MIEIIVVVGVVGILAALLYPSFGGVLPAAREQSAITKAEALNGAMFTFGKRIPNAGVQWSAANNAAKYVLLYDAGYLPNAQTTLATYQPGGFTFTFPTSLLGRVAIVGPAGAVVY